jgi:hypothetical protein
MYFKIPSQNLTAGTQDNHEKIQTVYLPKLNQMHHTQSLLNVKFWNPDESDMETLPIFVTLSYKNPLQKKCFRINVFMLKYS